MVKLTTKLIEILDLRKDSFTGADVKAVVEAIVMSESIPDEKDKKKQEKEVKAMEEKLKEWMLGGGTD